MSGLLIYLAIGVIFAFLLACTLLKNPLPPGKLTSGQISGAILSSIALYPIWIISITHIVFKKCLEKRLNR